MKNGDLRGHNFVAYTYEGDARPDGPQPVTNYKRRGTLGMPAAHRARGMSFDARRAGIVVHDDMPRRQDAVEEAAVEEATVEEASADPVDYSPRDSQTATAYGPEETRSSQARDRGPSDVEMQDGRRDKEDGMAGTPLGPEPASRVSRLATEVYTVSHLVFFAILGTLARLGLQALTTYPGAPVSFGVLWANVGGSLIMGFLAEDRKLFRHEWGAAAARGKQQQQAAGAGDDDPAAAKKAHLATKKKIPLYIGLATGFCGSFTSFSSFIRDVFLAMSNDLPGAGGAAPVPRNGGYSFMAMLAVILTTVSLCLSALLAGAHLAAALDPVTPSVPYPFSRKVLDRAIVLLGWGAWAGAVVLAVFPPHKAWRGQAVFSLVFAPLGCLARFYVSLWLNWRVPTFPLGTFAVNITGVAVLGMCWDLGHAGLGGVVGCQVLQGVEDGFCGCLTTVSTWVAELTALRRRHAYIYLLASVVVGFAVLVAVMGPMRWIHGFGSLRCIH